MANTRSLGIHTPTLTDIRVLSARYNKSGVYLKLAATLRSASPDLGYRFTTPVEFSVPVSDMGAIVPLITPTSVQDGDVRAYLNANMVRDIGASHSFDWLYAQYMVWGGAATRLQFGKILRTEFNEMVAPDGETFAHGQSMRVRGWSPLAVVG